MGQRALLVEGDFAVARDRDDEGGGACGVAHVTFDTVAVLHQYDGLPCGHIGEAGGPAAGGQRVGQCARAVSAEALAEVVGEAGGGVHREVAFINGQARQIRTDSAHGGNIIPDINRNASIGHVSVYIGNAVSERFTVVFDVGAIVSTHAGNGTGQGVAVNTICVKRQRTKTTRRRTHQ